MKYYAKGIQKFQRQLRFPVSNFTVTKNSANGKKIVEEPKPATAPITSDMKATMKNSMSSNMILDSSTRSE